MVLIGVDPRKAPHTAVVIDRDERELARSTVRASRGPRPGPSPEHTTNTRAGEASMI